MKKIEKDRKIWQKATDLSPLNKKTLDAGQNIENNNLSKNIPCAKKYWDKPHETIVKALEKIELRETSGVPDSEISLAPKNKNETFIVDAKNGEKSLYLELNLKNNVKDSINQKLISDELKKNFILDLTRGKFDLKNTHVNII